MEISSIQVLISSLIQFYSENILCVISVILNSLCFVLWLKIWYILVYHRCALEMNVFSCYWVECVIWILIRAWSLLGLLCSLFLLVFCLVGYFWEKVEASNCEFVCFSFQFLLPILSALFEMYAFRIVMYLPVFHKFTLSDTNDSHSATFALLWLMFTWISFFILLLSTYLFC